MMDVMDRSALSFRELLDSPGLIVAPGAYDGITARLVEQAGFPLVYMTGAGTAGQTRGFPDYGLLTMSEMVENAGVLARSVSVPVLADADTGYGNELNVTRTVQEFEAHGVAGIHLEDQVSPKRCGHLDGKEVVDRTRSRRWWPPRSRPERPKNSSLWPAPTPWPPTGSTKPSIAPTPRSTPVPTSPSSRPDDARRRGHGTERCRSLPLEHRPRGQDARRKLG